MYSPLESRKNSLERRFLAIGGEAAPAGLYAEFSSWIEDTTLRRLRIAAIAAIAINLPLFALFDYPSYRQGFLQSQPGFIYLVGWRITMVSLAALFLAAVSLVAGEGQHGTRARRWLARAYILVIALAGAVQSGIAHVLVDDVALFGMFICAIAAILPTPDRFRWSTYVAALLTFTVLAAIRKSEVIFGAMMANAIPAVLIAFIVDVILYRQLEEVFVLRKLTEAEREKSERLLRNVLPDAIATRLRTDPNMIAEGFPEATILFADLVGFTELAARTRPEQLVDMLNDIFGRFDDLAIRHGVEKIKTVGDAYMVACGIPSQNINHLAATADFAIAILAELERVNADRNTQLRLRVGIHSGYVVAGIIGHNKFSYDVWGDNVNLASRMESTGLAGHIQVTETVAIRLQDRYEFRERGSVDVKGKGTLKTYFLVGKRNVV